METPEPDRAGGVVYVCPEWVGGMTYADQRKCGHPFIFRSSYERHWREEHGDIAVDYDPDAMQGQRILGSWVDEAQRMPTLVEIRVDGPTNLLHYPPSPHMTGPGCACGPTEIDGVPDHLPTITTRGLGNGVAAAQDGPDIVALSADPRVQPPLLASPEVFSEVDRKEASARLDTYLERTAVPLVGIHSMRVTRLDQHGQPTGEPTEIVPHLAYDEWMGMPDTVGTQQRAHDVDVQLCCPDPRCEIRHHYCKVCEIVTLNQAPPLPCPGPREDT